MPSCGCCTLTVDLGGYLWVELGALVVLPNKLFPGHHFKLSYFFRPIYKSGMGLVCISKLFDL